MKEVLNLKNRIIDEFGNVFYKPEDILEKIYEGDEKYLNNIYTEESNDIKKFNFMMKRLNIDFNLKTIKNSQDFILNEEKIKELIEDWLIPEKYKNMDIEEWFFSKKLNKEEFDRVKKELNFFKRKNAYFFLKALIYLVDLMKENNIVWGPGRGSAVSSYCLYLIGIHRINPLEYDIPFEEFSRES